MNRASRQLAGSSEPLLNTVIRGSVTNRSGSITAGNTAQDLCAINLARVWLFFQNVSDEDMWLNFTTTAVKDQPSLKVAAGTTFEMKGPFVSTELISLIGTTTGKKFTCKEA